MSIIKSNNGKGCMSELCGLVIKTLPMKSVKSLPSAQLLSTHKLYKSSAAANRVKQPMLIYLIFER